jgi:hypothetical protein
VSGHHDGHWVGFVNTTVLLEWNGYRKVHTKPQRYGLMIDETKEYTWLGVNEMQALLRKFKEGFDTNKERLSIISLSEVVSLGPRCDLL